MRDKTPTYSIPDRRELTRTEFVLLERLTQQIKGLDGKVDELKVVARCGCGKCPTILFGKSFDDSPLTGPGRELIADYCGRAANGSRVGVLLWEQDGQLAELEAIGWDGEVDEWPPIEALVPSGEGPASSREPQPEGSPEPFRTPTGGTPTRHGGVWFWVSVIFLLLLVAEFLLRVL